MSTIPNTAPVKGVIGEKRMAKFDFELYPQLWERTGYAKVMKQLKWKYIFFNEPNHAKIPNGPGIYMFVVAPGMLSCGITQYIFYVGQAINLHTRYGNYLTEELGEDLEHDREKVVDFLSRFKGHIYYNYFECAANELDRNEDYLVDHIYPWANSRHKKNAKAKLLPPQQV